MKKSVALLSLAVAVKLVSQGALAKVSEEEAARLGNELTCTGAERAANADGSIPAFTGKYLGEAPGWDHVKHSGGKPVDPYPNEKPILVITAQNVEEHAKHLTEGQKAMFRKYPDTFRMDIYPGHRDYRYPDYVCERAKWNALNAEVVNDGMGVEGIGQVMFPIPKNGYELLWNHQLPARAWTEDAVRDLASVMPDGNIGWGRTHMKGLSPANHPTETPYTKTGVQAYSYNYTMLPTRDRGTAIAAHEPYNFTTSTRTAWSYNPGTRRVRQSPGYGYDQPMAGSNGTMIVDEDRRAELVVAGATIDAEARVDRTSRRHQRRPLLEAVADEGGKLAADAPLTFHRLEIRADHREAWEPLIDPDRRNRRNWCRGKGPQFVEAKGLEPAICGDAPVESSGCCAEADASLRLGRILALTGQHGARLRRATDDDRIFAEQRIERRRGLLQLIELSAPEERHVDAFDPHVICEVPPRPDDGNRETRLVAAFEEEARDIQGIDDIGRLKFVQLAPDDAAVSRIEVETSGAELERSFVPAQDGGAGGGIGRAWATTDQTFGES